MLTRNFSLGRMRNNDAVSHSGGCGWHMFASPRCIVVARRSSPPRIRDMHLSAVSIDHATALSLGCIHRREKHRALSAGLIPAVEARTTPSLSLHLLPAGLRTRRCDRHVRTTQKKPGRIRAPPALPWLVNILHAVGADLRPSTGRHSPFLLPLPLSRHWLSLPRLFANARGKERDGKARTTKKQHRLLYRSHISDYIFSWPWDDLSEDFIANEKFMPAVSSEASNMQCEKKSAFSKSTMSDGALFSITKFLVSLQWLSLLFFNVVSHLR